MNDLDNLIRASLKAHTADAHADAGLSARVQAKGQRVRRVRTASAAALVTVVVTAVAWGAALFPTQSTAPVVASPIPSAVATSTPSVAPTSSATGRATGPTARPSTSSDGLTRDVSTVGGHVDPGIYGADRQSHFASPSGNLTCFIGSKGAGCTAGVWDAGVVPTMRCEDGSPAGPGVSDKEKAAWFCTSDPQAFPYLEQDATAGSEFTGWWDETFGDSVVVKDPEGINPPRRLAVLPYGKTLVAGRFSCTMTTAGVVCRNPASGAGFVASKGKVSLEP